MRTLYCIGVLSSLLFFAGEARPCGGAFGNNYTIKPSQKLVVSYRDGVETYVFNPNFCGSADSFGLILPVPSKLTSNPSLGKQQLYTDLASIAAPTVVTTKECSSWNSKDGRSNGTGGSKSVGTGGATVIDRGQVGIFDWALIQATNVSSFTEWLTTNGFPFASTSVPTFQSYVDNGWYFVAFKVNAGNTTGTGGGSSTTNSTICGNFGPVSLSFETAPNPVIPARIAALSSTELSWDIFTIGKSQMRMQSYSPDLQFSGSIKESDLSNYPSIAQFVQAGDRLTELLLTSLPATDLVLEPDPNQADYRRVVNQTEYITCTGGASSTDTSTGGVGTGGSSLSANAGGVNNVVAHTSQVTTAGGNSALVNNSVSSGTHTTLKNDSINTAENASDNGCNVSAGTSSSRTLGLAAFIGALVLIGRRRRLLQR
jgi:Uncharacterized protein conserved in bacteria (DUF2330)